MSRIRFRASVAELADGPTSLTAADDQAIRPALESAGIEFICSQGSSIQLASYDQRLIGVARLLGIAEWNVEKQ